MQSIQQLRLSKAANRRTKQKADRQPEAKGLNKSSLPGSGTKQLRLPILTLCPASGFCPTFETFWTTKKGGSPRVIVAEPHPLM
uniref:Uncharacterized protein n=1 Tax=Zea mays TaxID=4577 RepID=C0PPF4_MAIZE|nr:unknown [Zea mays]